MWSWSESSGLPLTNGLERMQQHDHVEGEIVADEDADGNLQYERKRHDEPYRKPRGHHKTHHHRQRVGDGVEDAVAIVVEGNGSFAIAVDNEIAVLDELPGSFEADSQCKSRSDRSSRRNQPEQEVEKEAVNNVREGVPVADVLRVFRTLHDPVPKLDGAAFANPDSAHRMEYGCLQGDQHCCDHDARSPGLQRAIGRL